MKYIQGNILDAFEQNEINVLLHQENCEGLSYFAGFAKVLHQKHPELTKLHQEFCSDKPQTKNYAYKHESTKFGDRLGGSWYWLDALVFGNYLTYKVDADKFIINAYSQIFRGQPSNKFMEMCDAHKFPNTEEAMELAIGGVDNVFDTFENRCFALKEILNAVNHNFKRLRIGLPLIASGLAADKRLKGTMTDLEYFKKYIAPVVEEELKDLDVTVYYL